MLPLLIQLWVACVCANLATLTSESGLVPQQNQTLALTRRSIEDWQLAGLVLLSTIDGGIEARSRHTGMLLWSLKSPPLIEIESLDAMNGGGDGDDDGELVWIAEPAEDGSLMYFDARKGIVRIPAPIKTLIERAPFALEDNIVYTGSKCTSFYSIDVRSGKTLEKYGAHTPQCKTTLNVTSVADEDSVPSISSGALLLGRTEYVLDIYEKQRNRSWRVRLSLWGPNVRDEDLQASYVNSPDNLYLSPIVNQSVVAVTPHAARPQRWSARVSSPVIKIFDVFQSKEPSSYFVLLNQPVLNLGDRVTEKAMLVSLTAQGHAYAVSGPLFSPLTATENVAPWCFDRNSPVGDRRAILNAILGVHPQWCQQAVRPAIALPELPPFETRPDLQLSEPKLRIRFLASRLLEYAIAIAVATMMLFFALKYNWVSAESFSQVLPEAKWPLSSNERKPSMPTTLEEASIAVEPMKSSDLKKRRRGQRAGRKVKERIVAASTATDTASKFKDIVISNPPLAAQLTDSIPLQISDEILGYGSHGTVVLRGKFENREVAVKRMLLNFYDIAAQEITVLRVSDDHPNVIRYFCKYQTEQFLYIALQLCPGTLEDLIQGNKKEPVDGVSISELQSQLSPIHALQQITSGVHHLHSLKLVHRDIKPQNILVAAPKMIQIKDHNNRKKKVMGPVQLLISDFGLCKKLEDERSSFQTTVAGKVGTTGWSAPETFSARSHDNDDNANRLTKAVDIFSLGCVFYYVLSPGAHPFGEGHARQVNIEKGEYNLDELDCLTYRNEARDLIERMIAHNPLMRPETSEISRHPLFWDDQTKLDLLVRLSDRLEHESREPASDLLNRLEMHALDVVSENWHTRFPQIFNDNLGKYRKYQGNRILDLLRALRNKLHHYNDFNDEMKQCVGSLPSGYFNFFASRFPKLFMTAYSFVRTEFRHEEVFLPFFEP